MIRIPEPLRRRRSPVGKVSYSDLQESSLSTQIDRSGWIEQDF
ncbi:MAG: hypothetical protein AB1861_22615 [Cyanobacteriota bacterium]